MGFWTRLFGGEQKSVTLGDLHRQHFGTGREASSGVVVTTQAALEVSTVLACCRVISEGVAQVPWHLYHEKDGRKRIVSGGLDNLLYRRPNAWQTSFEFRETLMFHVILTGNAYVFVNRVGPEREIRELIPIEPKQVDVKQNRDMSLEYRVTSALTGEQKLFAADAIWHLRGPSWNSWLGLDAVKLARNAIGLSSTLEQGQAEFQKNGARSSGILAVEGNLNADQYEQLSKWLDRHQVGGDRSGKPLIVDHAAKFHTLNASSVDQQLLETRKHQIEEICREFRVFPQMVGHAGDQTPTFASAEQFFLAHVVHTLMPWYQRTEQSADVNLLTDDQRRAGFYTKLNPNALMRGAAKDRAEYYAKGLGSGGSKGWLTQNDVRGLEEMELSAEPEADKLPQPIAKPANPSEKPA
jgi:HK97 family phage portal protein